MKKAIVTGVYGQDGSYICELLEKKGVEIIGICRQKMSDNSLRIKTELEKEKIYVREYTTNLYEYEAIRDLIEQIQPDMIFHMAAVHRSSSDDNNNNVYREYELFRNNVTATGNILTACWECSPKTRVIIAGSCLMYDGTATDFQDENTAFASKSMYGLAKIAENQLVKYYRKKGLFACTAILYNHESHRRSDSFITKSIAMRMKDISLGKTDTLEIGDLSTQKDWGFAGDYAKAMYLMLEAEKPKDYIVSSGQLHTIREYIDLCMKYLDLDEAKIRIIENKSLITRKIETVLLGNPGSIERELGWKRDTSFEEMIQDILEGDQ